MTTIYKALMERVLAGEINEINPLALRLTVSSIQKKSATLVLDICDRAGRPIINCGTATVAEGCTLTLTDIHRSLTVKVS